MLCSFSFSIPQEICFANDSPLLHSTMLYLQRLVSPRHGAIVQCHIRVKLRFCTLLQTFLAILALSRDILALTLNDFPIQYQGQTVLFLGLYALLTVFLSTFGPDLKQFLRQNQKIAGPNLMPQNRFSIILCFFTAVWPCFKTIFERCVRGKLC